MKKILLLLVLILPISVYSQGHYIIPDIGAPDMAVYVEMIAPHDQKGYFGKDGFYLPGIDTEVQINVTKNSQYVTFGPMIVSWEGRLVSTHIFIDKSANPTQVTPDPAFQVEFEVTGTTVPSARSFTYNIVKPQSLGNNGDISAINETVLGQGNLGIRSERGAMIVDSLTLKPNTTYTVTTNDPDGDINNGNQGYFPAIILSKGPIKGNGSTIDVSAKSKNAGPGGGGGGGNFTDTPAGTGGSDGGSGFTSGGKGGTNRYASSSGAYKNFGNGTGSSGGSFNEIPSFDPVPFGGWEAAYGGTGHPFGEIGKQTLDGKTADGQGGLGGGSGYRNNTKGGAGGYATSGGGDAVTGGTTGGKVHGNKMIVPLAGGSGGAGGNPEASFFSPIVSSGDGGGGGGALNLFSPIIENLSIVSNGDDGRDGNDNSDGGPGSGGAASIMAKAGLTNFSLSAKGGSRSGRNGGAGRIRFDGFNSSNDPNYSPNNASTYRGISTDTSNYVKPRHRITGTHNSGDSLYIYIKTKTTDWSLYDSFSSGTVGWATNFSFGVNHEDEYYIVAIQKANLTVSDFTYEPGYVLSQAATNIFRFDAPKINCPKDTSYDVINCKDIVYEDSIQIQSIGGDFLPINVQDLWVFGDRGFKILNTGKYDISPQSPDSLFYIKFSYTKKPGQSGTITDTLLLVNQKLDTDTCRIAVNINLMDPKITFLDINSKNEIDTLNLGEICVGDLVNKKFILRNDSKFQLNDLDLVLKSNEGSQVSDFKTIPNKINSLSINEENQIDVEFLDTDNNNFVNGVSVQLLIYSKECSDPIDSIVIIVKVLNSELKLSEFDNSLDFGSVPVGQKKDMTVNLTNIGDRPALIQIPNPVNSPFSLINPLNSDFPILLQPVKIDPKAQIEFTYRFEPKSSGDFIDSTLFISMAEVNSNSCDAEIKMFLTGKSTIAEISFKDTLDFGILYECQIDSADAFIKNESNFFITIDTAGAKLVGGDIDHFQIANKPRTISQGGQNQFRIKYIPPIIPTTSGLKQSKIEFELEPTTGEIFEIFVKADVDTFKVDYSPGKPFDLGKIPVGFAVPAQKLTITNNGKLPRKLINFNQIVGSKLTLTPLTTLPITIPAGGSVVIDVNINLTASDVGSFSENVIAEFEECNTELPIKVVAEGVEGKLEILGNFNLGKIPPCFNLSEDVEFRNVGQADIRLDSVIIYDENGIENSRLNIAPIALNEYDGTNSFQTKYNLYGDKLILGKYKAKLIAYVFENGVTREYPVEINYEVSSGLIITRNPVDFGEVTLNNKVTQSVLVSKDPSAPFANLNDVNVNIDRANLVIPYNEYQFISPNSLLLAVGDNIPKSFDIEFTPTQSQNYDDTLQLYITIPGCDYNVPLLIFGSGAEGDTLLIYVKKMDEVAPDIDNFHIPIYAILKSKDNTKDKTMSVKISNLDIDFNKTVFFPKTITNGTYITRKTDPALSLIQIDMQTPVVVSNKKETILTELVGPTMLGNSKENLIHLGSTPALSDSAGLSKIISQSGYLNLTICEEGGQRLLEHTDGFDYTLFNTNGHLQINANLVEPGEHKVKLMNIAGSTDLIADINRTKNDKNEYTIDYDTNQLSSGVYFVIFETPTRFKTKKLVIIK
ncbi:choice-of-anchor D domain-containing protein [bacterium]|nr:MAG: choice-of-anchor D domain-containing protein [bacterium]